MKKSDLKKILKPLVNECIKESLLEDGLISGIIAEVVKGVVVTPSQPLVEAKQAAANTTQQRLTRNAFSQEQSHKLREHKNKLMSAIGGDSYNGINLFEGTTPGPAQTSPTQQGAPLAGQAPHDPGVDISNLLGAVGTNWKAHMNEGKERK